MHIIFHLKLDERSVQTASRILQQLGEVMQATQRRMRSKRIDDRFLLSQEFIQAMTRVTSNLIEAASILIQRYIPQYQHTNSPNWSLHISCCTSWEILLEIKIFLVSLTRQLPLHLFLWPVSLNYVDHWSISWFFFLTLLGMQGCHLSGKNRRIMFC